MSQGSYALSAKSLFGLALMQSIVQGVLIPMLSSFLTTKSEHQLWFRIYVVLINALALAQTIIHIVHAFDALNGIPERTILVAVPPMLTGLICAAVQAFFIHRCWRIYQQRFLAIIPLLLLWLAAFVSNIILGAFTGKPVQSRLFEARPGTSIPVMVWFWLICSLLFDSITTSSTIIYIYRMGTVSDGNRRILVVVWNVIWASATPPFVLTIIAVIEELSLAARILTTAMIGNHHQGFCLVANDQPGRASTIMQGYIRRLFERPYPSPPTDLRSSQTQTTWAGRSAAGKMTVHTVDVELQPTSRPEAIGSNANDSGDLHPDNASTKPPTIVKRESDLGHTVHSIDLTWKQVS
ncbi:unnamed protein product [Rhizoctonia solani]|uniref:Uncharacterized protein n=1 Tax=Rhizoctonia solani TaxID=456999 RepID=A0A8H3HJN6_9AGAM|nr:unnamed protein product [Rhizoctonia solani]